MTAKGTRIIWCNYYGNISTKRVATSIFTSVHNAATGRSKRVNGRQYTDQGHLDSAGYRMSHLMYGFTVKPI